MEFLNTDLAWLIRNFIFLITLLKGTHKYIIWVHFPLSKKKKTNKQTNKEKNKHQSDKIGSFPITRLYEKGWSEVQRNNFYLEMSQDLVIGPIFMPVCNLISNPDMDRLSILMDRSYHDLTMFRYCIWTIPKIRSDRINTPIYLVPDGDENDNGPTLTYQNAQQKSR